MKKVIIIGGGAGGAAAAYALQGIFDVTVLEEGGMFTPFSLNLSALGQLRKTGLFLDEREIQFLFPAMKVMKTKEKMVLVRGKGLGGTTTLSAGNALRRDHSLRSEGIDLDREFAELETLIPITDRHQNKWGKTTRSLFRICQGMNLDPFSLPKFGAYEHCVGCGRCVLGCRYGVKWDSRHFLNDAQARGAVLVTGCKVLKLAVRHGRVVGVVAQKGLRTLFYQADVVVLAAGGFSTPVILENSGIPCENHLFVDPVLCVAAEWQNSLQNRELSMPFGVQKEGYLLSPYFDYLSFFFNKDWHYPARDILTLMIKLSDTNRGSVDRTHPDRIYKSLTASDQERLKQGVSLCTEILMRMGVRKEEIFLGTVNAGHPGGTLPLTGRQAETLHDERLPHNLYVADASLFPASPGNPPILTIMALAMAIAARIRKIFG